MLKGPDHQVVFSETIAYELAATVGLRVPAYGLCHVPWGDGIYFASEKLGHRHSLELLWPTEKIANRELLSQVIVFDIWIANIDRNIGNLVYDSFVDGSETRLIIYAIDFEKSEVLRGDKDRFTIEALPLENMWPRETLGKLCNGLPVPYEFCTRIESITEDEVATAFGVWEDDLGLPRIEWSERARSHLMSRARRIRNLVHEVWR